MCVSPSKVLAGIDLFRERATTGQGVARTMYLINAEGGCDGMGYEMCFGIVAVTATMGVS